MGSVGEHGDVMNTDIYSNVIDISDTEMLSLWVNILLSCIGSYISYQIILEYIPVFVKRQMYGKDQCKVNNIPIPEPIGVISAAVYLIVMFIFIPFPVYEWSQLE
ncbi:unnamed protein product [Onchocerca flexuosa]|uniref:Dolichol kinase n=1 Tax=Onchocerca flexuosa TaxID=387005 RepID=A0A183HMF2_9BILA|nr:unnamed protein product [Onchocerca flexuosa]